MQTHNLVAHAGIVAHRMCAIHGDNRPCHHTVFNTCGEHTAMIGTQRADHIGVVAHRSRRESIALAGLDHHIVIFGEIGQRLIRLIGNLGRALAQRLAHVTASTTLHPSQNLIIATGDVDDHGLVVRHCGQHLLRTIGEPGVDTQERDVLVGLLDVVHDGVDDLALLSLGGLGDPRRPMHRAQIMITVRLKIDKGDHGDQFTITLDQIIAPWCASVDIRLKTRPNLGLFDRQRDAGLLGLGFQCGSVNFLQRDHYDSAILFRSYPYVVFLVWSYCA